MLVLPRSLLELLEDCDGQESRSGIGLGYAPTRGLDRGDDIRSPAHSKGRGSVRCFLGAEDSLDRLVADFADAKRQDSARRPAKRHLSVIIGKPVAARLEIDHIGV